MSNFSTQKVHSGEIEMKLFASAPGGLRASVGQVQVLFQRYLLERGMCGDSRCKDQVSKAPHSDAGSP